MESDFLHFGWTGDKGEGSKREGTETSAEVASGAAVIHVHLAVGVPDRPAIPEQESSELRPMLFCHLLRQMCLPSAKVEQQRSSAVTHHAKLLLLLCSRAEGLQPVFQGSAGSEIFQGCVDPDDNSTSRPVSKSKS